MPVSFVIGLAGLAFAATLIFLSITVQRIVAQTQSYSFLAVPFYLAGNLMNGVGNHKKIVGAGFMLTRRMYGEWRRCP